MPVSIGAGVRIGGCGSGNIGIGLYPPPYSVSFLAVGGGGGGGNGGGPGYAAGIGGGGGGGAMRCIGAKAGGSGIVIIAVPAAFYPGSAPGATVTNAPPSYPGVKLLTYPATPGTYTYIA